MIKRKIIFRSIYLKGIHHTHQTQWVKFTTIATIPLREPRLRGVSYTRSRTLQLHCSHTDAASVVSEAGVKADRQCPRVHTFAAKAEVGAGTHQSWRRFRDFATESCVIHSINNVMKDIT